jgi:hypothetical protein
LSVTVPLDERYLDWLYSLVAPVTSRNPARSYRLLFEHLFKTPFLWFIPNDDNRIEDGRELRLEFLEQFNLTVDDPNWMELDVSVMEMLIALSRRTAYWSESSADFWFWQFLEKLEIRQYTDSVYRDENGGNVDEVLDCLINRTYTSSGLGGLFPLRRAMKDQRTVELWYQMSAYLLENDYSF